MATRSSQRLVITVPEAAKQLGIGRNQAYEAAQKGQIPALRIGRRLVVPVSALEAKLASANAPSSKTSKR
jgi:excisionase family DNA binding protein